MNQKAIATAGAALLLLGSTSAHAANLLSNGDFATGTLSSWTQTGGPVQDTQPNRVVVYSNPGNIYGESVPQDPYSLTTTHAAYFSSDVPTVLGAGISQTFNVAHTGSYVISFDYYIPSNGVANPYDAGLTVSDGGGTLASFDAQGLGNHGWKRFTTTQTLTAGWNDLTFNLTVPQNYAEEARFQYGADFIMTNASVSGVPEPATWAFMIIGFFGLGALLRRRGGLALRATA